MATFAKKKPQYDYAMGAPSKTPDAGDQDTGAWNTFGLNSKAKSRTTDGKIMSVYVQSSLLSSRVDPPRVEEGC